MSSNFHVIIPARYASARFPGKLLMDLNGQSILQRVYARALLANPKTLTIATDDVRIFEAAEGFGASVTMTKDTHLSGTERVAEVVARGGFSKDDIIVNVQGDEP